MRSVRCVVVVAVAMPCVLACVGTSFKPAAIASSVLMVGTNQFVVGAALLNSVSSSIGI